MSVEDNDEDERGDRVVVEEESILLLVLDLMQWLRDVSRKNNS